MFFFAEKSTVFVVCHSIFTGPEAVPFEKNPPPRTGPVSFGRVSGLARMAPSYGVLTGLPLIVRLNVPLNTPVVPVNVSFRAAIGGLGSSGMFVAGQVPFWVKAAGSTVPEGSAVSVKLPVAAVPVRKERGGPRNSDQRLSDKKRREEGEEKDNLNNQ